jgi:ABC-type multidrug transport system ATPase subunit
MAIMDKGMLLYSGTTDDALNQIKDKVYEKRVEKSELQNYQDTYKIISNKLVGGKPQIHVFSETVLNSGFEKAEETLEDVFFAKLNSLI